MREELPTFGEFLVSLALISKDEARDIARLSGRLGMTFAELVPGYKKISNLQLSLLVQVHSLLLDGLIDEPVAEKMAQDCVESQCSVESLYKKYEVDASAQRFRLGDLLLASDAIDNATLLPLLEKTAHSGKPLGHAIIEARVLSPEAVSAALNCQADIRFKGKLPSNAISELKKALANPETLAESDAVLKQ